MDRSPTIGQMFAHMHHERMVSVLENAPEHAGQIPAHEWSAERDAHRIAQMPEESATRVRDAVTDRVDSDRALDRSFAHPVQLLQFLIFYEGYHHGQIKLALKAAGCAIADADAGPSHGTSGRPGSSQPCGHRTDCDVRADGDPPGERDDDRGNDENDDGVFDEPCARGGGAIYQGKTQCDRVIARQRQTCSTQRMTGDRCGLIHSLVSRDAATRSSRWTSSYTSTSPPKYTMIPWTRCTSAALNVDSTRGWTASHMATAMRAAFTSTVAE